MRRRTLLTGLTSIAGLSTFGFGLRSAWNHSGQPVQLDSLPDGMWANWSRNQLSRPKEVLRPNTIATLREAIVGSTDGVRIVGAGHSFSELVPTDGTIINLDRITGVLSADSHEKTARIYAGTRLRDLSPAFHERGLAFKNLGDIDVQSFAGAASTATHGTGKAYSCLAAETKAIRLMIADGSIIEASSENDPSLLHAAQVSLGALGAIVEAEVSLCKSFNLRRRTWTAPIAEILAESHARWEQHRNYEFFYVPFSGYGVCISHDETDEEPTPRLPSEDDTSLMSLKQVRDFAGWNVSLRRSMLEKAISEVMTENVVGIGWSLLANERNIRFNEMEYHLPVDTALDVLNRVIEYIEKEREDVFFPIEVRMTAADDAWLSPFQGASRISIAVHAYYGDDFEWFFSDIEPIFLKAGGRPHWGKLHSLQADELRKIYPNFEDFCETRRVLDPGGKFMTPYMASLWGESLDS